MGALAEWLASFSRDIFRFYTYADEACQLSPGNRGDQYSQRRVQEVVFGLCVEHDALRDADVESGLVYFACAYAHRSDELLEGKFPSYHHAVYSLACEVVVNIRSRLELHPPDWTLLVEDLNRRAIDFKDLAEACGPLRNRLDQELAIAINLQTPISQQATRVASAGASAGRGTTDLSDSDTEHGKGVAATSSIALEETARSKVALPEVDQKLCQVRYDGTCHEVTSEAARLFAALVEKHPHAISAGEVVSKPSQVKKSLPSELKALIKAESGKGTWLELRPAAPEFLT
jgi:hypothetical protein